ncbi:MAG TPA: hypothetical protein VF735_06565 [Pyrinomonadaceae bacterium]|jgi:cell wall-associated NlpC family hydrolase
METVITRQMVEDEARRLLGVPWRHQGNNPDVGIDCRGLIEVVAQRLTGRVPPVRKYPRMPKEGELYRGLAAEMDEKAIADIRRADVALIQFPREKWPRHCGIIVSGLYEPLIIHAYEPSQGDGHVIEEPLRRWQRYITNAFEFREVVD